MQTYNQCQTKAIFLTIQGTFFSAKSKDTFEYLMVWLKIEGAAMPLKIIEAPSSFKKFWWSRTNSKDGLHASWRHDQIPKSVIVNNITWVGTSTQKWYRSITPWEVTKLPRSDDFLTESHISVSQPCRRTHWQSKLAYPRDALLKDLAGQ